MLSKNGRRTPPRGEGCGERRPPAGVGMPLRPIFASLEGRLPAEGLLLRILSIHYGYLKQHRRLPCIAMVLASRRLLCLPPGPGPCLQPAHPGACEIQGIPNESYPEVVVGILLSPSLSSLTPPAGILYPFRPFQRPPGTHGCSSVPRASTIFFSLTARRDPMNGERSTS